MRSDVEAGQCIVHCCLRNDFYMLRDLLDEGGDPNTRDRRGRTGLHIAASKNDTEMMQVLLDHNAELNVLDCQGNTVMHYCGHEESIQLLVDYAAGSQVHMKNFGGATPVTLAKRRGISDHIIEILENLKNTSEPIPDKRYFPPPAAPVAPPRLELPAHPEPEDQADPPSAFDNIKNAWFEFCTDLGPEKLACLLVLAVFVSLYVAYAVSTYSKRLVQDTRIPVPVSDDNFSEHIEL
ncbi:unnamed protein product [Owenia fusiformis]|uniref:Uncharacterized protein n=1 Tax=Owenia fusiformis TaxID=6347 RepID=A0A8J1XMP6_OWEFU|nr:unnamed protein product [Owenia fusiformis]